MYETIPDLNLFMVCKVPNQKAYASLPDGFYFDLCKPQELDLWKAFPFENPTPKDEKMMTDYFANVYESKKDLFFSRCVFVRDQKGTAIATCFLWKAYNQINTLHWLKVKTEYEGKGIGRALITKLLSQTDTYPIYLHTQPSSYRAIKLYSDFGFQLITNSGYLGSRTNDLQKCLPILQTYMSKSAMENLKFTSAPAEFVQAVQSSNISEF